MSNSLLSNKSKILKLAEWYVEQGMITAAIDEYEKILNVDPNAFTNINTLGDLYARVGRSKDAIDIFSRIAESYCENGFTLKAIAMYKKISKLEPHNHEISLKIGELYAKQGLIVESRQWFQAIAESYKKSGHTSRMLETFKKSADLEPENGVQWRQLAEAYQTEGFNYEAHEAFLQAGRGFLNKGHYPEALEVHQKALAINPNSRPAIKTLIYIFIQQNELQKALVMLTQSLEKEPDDIDLLILLGRACLNANLLEEAEAAFSHLLELDGSRYAYLMEVGNKYLENRQFDKVIAIEDLCLELSLAYRQEGKAISLLKAVLDSEPNHLQALLKLACIYRHTGENKQLEATLTTIVDVARQVGSNSEAISALRELIKLEPDETIYKRQLVKLTGLPLANKAAGELVKEPVPQSPENIENLHEMDKLDDTKASASEKLTMEVEVLELAETQKGIENSCEPACETGGLDLSDLLFDVGYDFVNNSVTDRLVSHPKNLAETLDQHQFEMALENEWKRAKRNIMPISLILLSINNFVEQDNNGDHCLEQMAGTLKGELKRAGDLVAVYSRHEVAILLPGVPAEGAATVAKRLRDKIGSLSITKIGVGISTAVPQRRSSPTMMIANARKALYEENHKDTKTQR